MTKKQKEIATANAATEARKELAQLRWNIAYLESLLDQGKYQECSDSILLTRGGEMLAERFAKIVEVQTPAKKPATRKQTTKVTC